MKYFIIFCSGQERALHGSSKLTVSLTGLEKLTNANRSVSAVNDQLFPVELTEIADWTSMSKYMLHLNFKQTFGVFWCIYRYFAAFLIS